jgi:hypothetical protein
VGHRRRQRQWDRRSQFAQSHRHMRRPPGIGIDLAQGFASPVLGIRRGAASSMKLGARVLDRCLRGRMERPPHRRALRRGCGRAESARRLVDGQEHQRHSVRNSDKDGVVLENPMQYDQTDAHPDLPNLTAEDLKGRAPGASFERCSPIKSTNGRRVSVHWFAGVLQSLCSPRRA